MSLKLPISSFRGQDAQGKKRKLQVPEAALPLVKTLLAKYSLDVERVRIAGRDFFFLHVADLIPLFHMEVNENAPEFPFWVKIWEASLVLSEFLAKIPPKQDRRILELGAGMAVPGMVASSLGHHVTVTDYEDEIMDFVRVSAIFNACDDLKCEALDWFEPREDMGQFEIIIGSELLFHPRFFPPLLNVIKKYLAPSGVVYMAHKADRETLFPFFKMAEEDFSIAMQKHHFKSPEKEMDVLLTRLTRKQH